MTNLLKSILFGALLGLTLATIYLAVDTIVGLIETVSQYEVSGEPSDI